MTTSVFHVELRQFPHNFCRFNLSEPELHANVLDRWSRGEQFELGERRWDPRQASLTVIEGPRLSMHELAMGRGWRNATRGGEDVTERMLGADLAALRPATDGKRADGNRAGAPGASLGAGIVALLGEDPLPLLQAWQLALERHPDRPPSECLALAEDLLRR
ncbi:MAG TPA: hypothetical protein VFW38_05950 [Solirubrobacteraceae bacterium]|nr:hypothetical protein [Solirubrobacteraceae bacterium]